MLGRHGQKWSHQQYACIGFFTNRIPWIDPSLLEAKNISEILSMQNRIVLFFCVGFYFSSFICDCKWKSFECTDNFYLGLGNPNPTQKTQITQKLKIIQPLKMQKLTSTQKPRQCDNPTLTELKNPRKSKKPTRTKHKLKLGCKCLQMYCIK